MKVLFLCLYPLNAAPSQRFRFEQFFPYFKKAGILYDTDSFYSQKAHQLLYKPGHHARKMLFLLSGFFKRLYKLNRFRKYDFIFIQRAAAPAGPALFEFMLAKIFHKKIIYDFDDAIWMPQDGKGNALFRWVKNYGKVGKICKWSYKVTVGNEFLAQYARQFTSEVVIIPTVVDTHIKYNIVKEFSKNSGIVVGWTGSHSTIRYLLSLQNILFKLDEDPDIHFLVIADKPPQLNLQKLVFLPWNSKEEIEDLLKMDIGIMPLVDNDWTRGKCGFKAIQYMALGIPALVSPVGVNERIVDDGVNGFICKTPDDWVIKIQLLKNNPLLRNRMGMAARIKIEQSFSVNYAFPLMLSILKGV